MPVDGWLLDRVVPDLINLLPPRRHLLALLLGERLLRKDERREDKRAPNKSRNTRRQLKVIGNK